MKVADKFIERREGRNQNLDFVSAPRHYPL